MRQKYHNWQEIVYRLSQPGSPSIAVISVETSVPKATLYAWLAAERRMSRAENNPKDRLAMTKRSKPRSPSVKFTLLAESYGLQGDALQTFCNERGVTVEELLSWRDLALSGIELAERDGLGATRKDHDQIVADLEEDLRRKNDALAEDGLRHGNPESSEKWARQAMELQTSSGKPSGIWLGRAGTILGLALYAQRKTDLALSRFQEADQTLVEALGSQHPLVHFLRLNAVAPWRETGQKARAAAACDAALGPLREAMGPLAPVMLRVTSICADPGNDPGAQSDSRGVLDFFT